MECKPNVTESQSTKYVGRRPGTWDVAHSPKFEVLEFDFEERTYYRFCLHPNNSGPRYVYVHMSFFWSGVYIHTYVFDERELCFV